jgi:hypothetical protein
MGGKQPRGTKGHRSMLVWDSHTVPNPAEPRTARAKVSPKPWNWEKSHEIGCCYPVGAYREGASPT